ncbi:MAG: hypothetical protein NC331_12490 [Lachnospiraceae bacterium]|nr:hypothetical protein [Lachnospiraceae bacterium]MCM1240186.1 hypothetical protein [Lachnospiraceae bacterium]MCM1304095.1 hypothetical protein [Butyrivibrio sp.]
MDNDSLYENAMEELMDGMNVLHLLGEELAGNQDDPHITRSVGVVLKILQAALSDLQHMKKE